MPDYILPYYFAYVVLSILITIYTLLVTMTTALGEDGKMFSRRYMRLGVLVFSLLMYYGLTPVPSGGLYDVLKAYDRTGSYVIYDALTNTSIVTPLVVLLPSILTIPFIGIFPWVVKKLNVVYDGRAASFIKVLGFAYATVVGINLIPATILLGLVILIK